MIPLKYKVQTLLFALTISFVGCTTDEETVIVPKTPEQYKTEFGSFVSSEKTKVETCVVGFDKGNFRTSTKFDALKADYLTVLNGAETILAKTDVTIPDIINANKTLGTPGKAFAAEYFLTDRRALNDLVVACEALSTATVEGTAVGQVPTAAKTAFTTAITAAKTTRSLVTAIDRVITEAVDKLKAAKTTFEAAIIK